MKSKILWLDAGVSSAQTITDHLAAAQGNYSWCSKAQSILLLVTRGELQTIFMATVCFGLMLLYHAEEEEEEEGNMKKTWHMLDYVITLANHYEESQSPNVN